MIDLIKTFILGLFIDKKYRYLLLFIIIASVYRFLRWLSVIALFTITNADFKQINNDGSLSFNFIKYEQKIYPKKYQLPTKNGKKNKNFDMQNIKDTKSCEQKFFNIYVRAVNDLIGSSKNKKFILHFDSKIPINIGDISYFDANQNEKYIYDSLKEQGMIFDREDEIDYCEELKKVSKR